MVEADGGAADGGKSVEALSIVAAETATGLNKSTTPSKVKDNTKYRTDARFFIMKPSTLL